MGDLFNLDISSVKIVNKSKNKVNHKDRLNKYTERFSKLIKQYLDDPSVYDELLLIFKAIKRHGAYLQDTYISVFVIKLDNGWYEVRKDDPVTHDDDPIWECYIREKLTYDIISVTDRLELDDLVKAYRKKCKKGKTSSRPFNDMSSENY